MEDDDSRIIAELRSDALLGVFFDDKFDGAAFVRSLLRADVTPSTSLDESAVEKTLHGVRQRAGQLDVAIRDLVARHQDALVLQAGASAALKRHLTGVKEHLETVEEGLQRLRADVLEPFTRIKLDSVVLSNATIALDLLRRTQRAHQSIRRVRTLAGSFTDVNLNSPSSLHAMVFDTRAMTRLAPLLHEVSNVSFEWRIVHAAQELLPHPHPTYTHIHTPTPVPLPTSLSSLSPITRI